MLEDKGVKMKFNRGIIFIILGVILMFLGFLSPILFIAGLLVSAFGALRVIKLNKEK